MPRELFLVTQGEIGSGAYTAHGLGLARFLSPPALVHQVALASPRAWLRGAAAVLTESGRVQEETTALGVPCLNRRDTTVRPITIEEGTNRLGGGDPEALVPAFEALRAAPPSGRVPASWDGRAAGRVAAVLASWQACPKDARP